MKYFFDTEFIEGECSIDLISIGIIAEDGREYYAISSDFDPSRANRWVLDNVISRLGNEGRKSKTLIASEVEDFTSREYGRPEFWADYAAYDWVVFCWLFGSMMSLPKHYPFFCCDIQQEASRYPGVTLPQPVEEHNALSDARNVRDRYNLLCSIQSIAQ